MLDFSGISHDLLLEPFFIIFSALLILVTRGLHWEFLSVPFLLASALGKACYVLWFMRRWDGREECTRQLSHADLVHSDLSSIVHYFCINKAIV